MQHMTTFPYKEGSVFQVPLKNGAAALGVVARKPKGGKIVLGYFFSASASGAQGIELAHDLKAGEASHIFIFGDPYIKSGRWPIVGEINNWSRETWPVPKFLSRDPLSGKNYLVTYSDSNLILHESREPCGLDTAGYPTDGVGDAEFVEISLTRSAVGLA